VTDKPARGGCDERPPPRRDEEGEMTEQPHPNEPTIASDSPVVSVHEIEIEAPIDRVWGVLTAIERWPAWNRT
jgi:hypothetical protein